MLLQMRDEQLRDLGGLILEMFRRNHFNDELVRERCSRARRARPPSRRARGRVTSRDPPGAAPPVRVRQRDPAVLSLLPRLRARPSAAPMDRANGARDVNGEALRPLWRCPRGGPGVLRRVRTAQPLTPAGALALAGGSRGRVVCRGRRGGDRRRRGRRRHSTIVALTPLQAAPAPAASSTKLRLLAGRRDGYTIVLSVVPTTAGATARGSGPRGPGRRRVRRRASSPRRATRACIPATGSSSAASTAPRRGPGGTSASRSLRPQRLRAADHALTPPRGRLCDTSEQDFVTAGETR